MTGIASTLKSRSPRTDPAGRALTRAMRVRSARACVCARALLPTRARACRRERVPASPRERFNFDHLCPRVRAPRLTRTAAVNYQGSIALTRKAPIRMSACLLRARAGGSRVPFHC